MDSERADRDNELCKLLLNVSPFDQVFSSARETAAMTEKSKDVGGKLEALTASELFNTAKEFLTDDFDLYEAMSKVVDVFEDFDICCRDVPATKPQPETITTAISSILTQIAQLADPVFAKVRISFKQFEEEVGKALSDTAAAGPDPEVWKRLLQDCSISTCNMGLRKCMDVVNKICNRVGTDQLALYVELEKFLQTSSALTDVCKAVGDIAGDEGNSQFLGEACQRLHVFEKLYHAESKARPSISSRAALLLLCDVAACTYS